MAVYRIFPEKDATIWDESSITSKYGNAGKDEILEIGGYPDPFDPAVGRTNRSLIQFKTSELSSAIAKTSGTWSASLELKLANAGELPQSYTVQAYPLSSSWVNGVGKKDDLPYNTSGVSWKFKDAQTTEWDSLGGDYLTTLSGSTTNSLLSDHDLSVDITNIVTNHYNGSIENNGVIIKLEHSLEGNTTASINLKYFSSDTNTIFPPYLEFKWDDSSYSSTLTELNTDIATVSIKNHKEKYIDSEQTKFRISARPKHPARSFSTSSIYLTEYRLPQASYWGIKDEYSGEMIVNFDSNYTKISADDTSSYFDLDMSTLKPERYYRLLIKTTLNGSVTVLDDNNIFKVVRHG